MRYIKQKSNKCYLLNLHVKSNAKRQYIRDNIDYLFISIRSKAVQNRANKELINFLKIKLKISSNQIKIVSGLKSSIKTIQLDFNEEITNRDIYKKLFS
jgi:uncharacterized protein (TIGR00251 family)